MKTTIDIADALLRSSKEAASRDHLTLRSLVEEGLRKVLHERTVQRRSFKLRPIKFGTGGFQPEFGDGEWSRMRDEIYKGRGA